MLKMKEKTIAFTGHRMIPVEQMDAVRMLLNSRIREAYRNGYRCFLCGMALGFDMLAAEEILSLKEGLPELKLVAVVPFRNQDALWTDDWKQKYRRILKQADRVILLNEIFYRRCLLDRNDFMLKHCSKVIAFFNGSPKGGSFYTCKEAERMGISVENLYRHR